MPNSYFVGTDGSRRDFDATGREIGSPVRRPVAGGGTVASTVRAPVGPPAGLASQAPPRMGDVNTFMGANGQIRQVLADGTVTGTGSKSLGRSMGVSAPPSAAPVAGSVLQSRPMARLMMPDPAGRFQSTRPMPRPSRSGLIDPRGAGSEMVRRAEMASSRLMDMARSTPGTYTAAQLRAAEAAVRAPQQFWLDQASSIGPEAQQRFTEAQRLRSREQESLARQRSMQNIAEFQQQGAMAQQAALQQFELTRPQQPITLSDGLLGRIGPNGEVQPITMPDGSLARAPTDTQETNPSALARLVPELSSQLSGIDEYGMVADAEAPKGRRPATSADREAALRQATTLAREILNGRPQARTNSPTNSGQGGTRPVSLDEFLDRARAANPGVSDDDLADYFRRTYAAR